MKNREPNWRLIGVLMRFGHFIPDKIYLTWLYRLYFGEKIDWKNPKTYNEKCNWMKLYHRHPMYTNLADKIKSKQYVESILGPGHVFPILAIFDSVSDIKLDELPNQFVIKTNNDSGCICICKDKDNDIFVKGKSDNQTSLSFEEVKTILKKSLNSNFYYNNREWPYKNIKPRILVEPYMQNQDGSGLKDYKFFCFNGEPKYIWMGTNYTPMYFDIYSTDWTNQHVEWGYCNAPSDVPPPPGYEQMLEMARKLSKGIPHVRVDFYNIDGNIYVGEFTFYTWAGLCELKPNKWNRIMGDLIDLSKIEIIK